MRSDAAGRLAMFLEMYEARLSYQRGTERGIYLPMSRRDIAQYVGLTIEAVSRQITKFQRLGILEMDDGRHLRIVDRQSLARLSTGRDSRATHA